MFFCKAMRCVFRARFRLGRALVTLTLWEGIMKKQLIKMLAFILLFSSVLSNGNGIALAEETGTWSIQQQVDEFGDVIPNSKPVIITPFSGTFDNTATKNEKLTGFAYFQIMSDNSHYALGFQLLEYGNIDATFLDSDKKP